jgi:DNA polymerase III subunit delta
VNLRLNQLAAHIAKGQFTSLYLVHGDELLLQIEATDALRAAALAAGYSEREVWTVEQHFKWDEAMAQQDNLSLFASRKLTEIRVPSGKLGVEGGERMRTLAAHASPQANADQLVIASFPKLDKTQQASAWFSAWMEAGATVIETMPIEREQLAAWLAERFRAQAQTPDTEALEFLVEHCEGNLMAAKQEVQKLGLICPTGALSRADVEDAVTNVARYTIAQLSDAFLRGELERFTQVLQGLRAEGESIVPITWQLSDDVHALARAITYSRGNVPAGQAVKQARIWGKRALAVEVALKRVNPRAIAPLVQQFATLDAAGKGLRPHVDVWAAVTQAAQRLYAA